MMWILPDAHAHIGREAEMMERIQKKIPTLLCGTNPEQMGVVMAYAGVPDTPLIPTCGLHPWYADCCSVAAMGDYFEPCTIVGEIGMDSQWCDVPLNVQLAVFEDQLKLAVDQKKPVILHTKGMEREIVAMIASYPNQYLVHWYSAVDHLEQYLKLDCYVSIGPDVWWNEAVQQVARRIPSDRILIETDGMEAVRWAYEEGAKVSVQGTIPQMPKTVQQALEHTLEVTAEIRGEDTDCLAKEIRENFWRFCSPL